MRRHVACMAAIVAAGVLAAAAPAEGQRFALGARAGAAIGGYEGTNAGWERVPGPAVALSAELELVPYMAAYLGVGATWFGCENGYCTGRDARLTTRGVTAGVRWRLPGREPGPWIRTAVAYHQLRLDAGATEQADPELGFEIAVGIFHRLGPSLRLAPEVAYLQHHAAAAPFPGDAATVAIALGVVWSP